MIITTSTDHDFVTGERVHFAGDIYWVRVLSTGAVQLYTDSSLTTVAASVENADFTSSVLALSIITPLDRAPDITIYPRSRYTNDGRGIIGAFIFETSITTNVTNYDIKTAALASGWDGNSILYATITINAGVYVWTDTTSTPALVTGTGLPDNSKIEIINNGYIIGKGGHGGGWLPPAGQPAEAGGPAMSINTNVTITNNSYIAGGGGGGLSNGSGEGLEGGGGGAGGGAGGRAGDGFTGSAGPEAAGGGPGSAGANGVYFSDSGVGFGYGGGGGGRILPGVGGAGGAANGDVGDGGGAGGGGASAPWPSPGGSGGSANAVGGTGMYRPPQGQYVDSGGGAGGGGGWGAAGGSVMYYPYPSIMTGPPGGKAINLNGYLVTFITTGTVYGAVS